MNASTNSLFLELGLLEDRTLIGSGVNAEVYEYGEGQVVKIFKHADLADVERLKDFYDRIVNFDLPFSIPLINRVGQAKDNTVYSIEKRIEGKEMKNALSQMPNDIRIIAIQNYIEATGYIGHIKLDNERFGELNNGEQNLTADAWHEYLRMKTEKVLVETKDSLRIDIPNIELILEKFYRNIDALKYNGDKSLVHGDYFPPNVLFDSAGNVTAVIDFSDLTCVGDRRMDLASALFFLESSKLVTGSEMRTAYEFASERFGSEGLSVLPFYKTYYALLFSGCKETDPETFDWVVKTLNENL